MISEIGNGLRIILARLDRVANEGEYLIAIRALKIAEYSAPDEDFNFPLLSLLCRSVHIHEIR